MAEEFNNDKVGYGRPPKHSRFQKGKSGNPKGRPRGARNLRTELEEELAECMVVREGGREIRVSKLRALIKSQTARGLKGDPRAAQNLLTLVLRLLPDQPEQEAAINLTQEQREILETYKDLVRRGLV